MIIYEDGELWPPSRQIDCVPFHVVEKKWSFRGHFSLPSAQINVYLLKYN